MAGSTVLQRAQVVDYHLTQLAQGFSLGGMIGEQVAPRVNTPKMYGRYVKWDKASFRLGDSVRGLGEKTKRDNMLMTYGSYTMPIGYARSVAIDDREDRQTAGVSNVNMSAQKLKGLQRKMALQLEKDIASYAVNVANYTTTKAVSSAGSGGWTLAAADIFGDIEKAKESVRALIGQYPNTLILSPDMWPYFRMNTGLKSFFVNTTAGAAALDTKMVAGIMGLDDILIGTGSYVKDDATTANIWGTAFAALIYRGEVSGNGAVDPTDLAPSFMWNLHLTGYPIVVRFRDEDAGSEVIKVEDNWQPLVTSLDAGCWFTTPLT